MCEEEKILSLDEWLEEEEEADTTVGKPDYMWGDNYFEHLLEVLDELESDIGETLDRMAEAKVGGDTQKYLTLCKKIDTLWRSLWRYQKKLGAEYNRLERTK